MSEFYFYLATDCFFWSLLGASDDRSHHPPAYISASWRNTLSLINTGRFLGFETMHGNDYTLFSPLVNERMLLKVAGLILINQIKMTHTPSQSILGILRCSALKEMFSVQNCISFHGCSVFTNLRISYKHYLVCIPLRRNESFRILRENPKHT